MVTSLLSAIIGFLLSILAGLGVGGGSLLILWLTLVMGVSQTTARAINLLFFLAAAGSVSLLRLKKGKLNFKAVVPAVIAGCLSAALFSWLGTQIEQAILRKFFGILLLFTGVRELFYRPRKAK